MTMSPEAGERIDLATMALRAFGDQAVAALRNTFGDPDQWPRRTDKKGNEYKIDPTEARDLLWLLTFRQERGGRLYLAPAELGIDDAWECKRISDSAHHRRGTSRYRDGDEFKIERIVAGWLAQGDKRPELSIASVKNHHLEVFELRRGEIYHRWYPGSDDRWSDWTHMDSSPAVALAAVGGDDSLHLLILNTAGRIEERAWTIDGGWGHWQGPPAKTKVLGPISAVSFGKHHLEIFAFNESAERVHRWSHEGSWSEWHRF